MIQSDNLIDIVLTGSEDDSHRVASDGETMEDKSLRFVIALGIAGLVLSACDAQPESDDSAPRTTSSATGNSKDENLAAEAEAVLLEEWDVDVISDRCEVPHDWQCGFESFESEGTGDSLIVNLQNTQEVADEPGLASEVANELRAALQPSIARLRQITVYVDGKPQASAYRLPD